MSRPLNYFDNTCLLVGEANIGGPCAGSAQYITAPTPARALTFDLQLDTPAYDESETFARIQDSDSRLMEMVAAQAHHREGTPGGDEEVIAMDDNISDDEKRETFQKSLNMAASNGDVARIRKLVGGRAKAYVDVNKTDEEGTVPLIYASCFGHSDVVAELLNAGADVDKQDRNQWSALMWAMTNRHKQIAKLLLDHGANPDIRSSSGGTAYDFVQPGSDFSHYLTENGYQFGGTEMEGDFYQTGFDPGKLDEEYAETEMKRRQLMQESAANLEVDLGSLGFGEEPESPLESDEEEFIWDRCVGDQMYVFQTQQLDAILDLIITNMTPQRSSSQKPVPANLIFLMARYAHYHMTSSLLEEVLTASMDRIADVIERHQWDMTMLAFWISNETLLLHYLKKDPGLMQATGKWQAELADLVNETFILIIRDAERRMNKLLDQAMLDYETIPGFDTIEFQGEFKLFKSKAKPVDEPSLRPPSPKRRAQTSPRNVTSLLSSVLFVLDLYDTHSVITAQILAQLMYWLGAELLNRILTTRKYLSRTKAMQIRHNVSQLEDWTRANNRQPEHYENGSKVSTGEDTVSAARRHLAPVIQLLQWLQVQTSLSDDHETLIGTLVQLQKLTPAMLIHAAKQYRLEVGEKSLPKKHMKFLMGLQKGQETLISKVVTPVRSEAGTPVPEKQLQQQNGGAERPRTPNSPLKVQTGNAEAKTPERKSMENRTPTSATLTNPTPSTPAPSITFDPSSNPDGTGIAGSPNKNALMLDPSLMLPFSLPTSTDMLISYGAGIGGTNRERARKYIPTIPYEILGKLAVEGSGDDDQRARRKGSVGTVGTTAGAWRGGSGS